MLMFVSRGSGLRNCRGDRRGAALDSTSSTLGGTLSNKEINDLPLNGRNYENLLQLRPGVIRYPGGGFSTTSTNGLRAEDNAYFWKGCLTVSLTPGKPS